MARVLKTISLQDIVKKFDTVKIVEIMFIEIGSISVKYANGKQMWIPIDDEIDYEILRDHLNALYGHRNDVVVVAVNFTHGFRVQLINLTQVLLLSSQVSFTFYTDIDAIMYMQFRRKFKTQQFYEDLWIPNIFLREEHIRYVSTIFIMPNTIDGILTMSLLTELGRDPSIRIETYHKP